MLLCGFFFFSLCAASETQLWMSGVSSHPSISAACESSANDQVLALDDQSFLVIYSFVSCFSFLCQGSSVHMEQVEPAEKRSSEFSYAAGAGIRPHPPGPGRATPRSPGQASVWSHSNCQAVYGVTRPRQHANRGPNEPPTSLETRDRRKQEQPGLNFPSLEKRKWMSPVVKEGDAE